MTDLSALLEGSALAGHLRASRWTYPLVSAGHVFGLALLLGAVVAMDLRILGALRGPDRQSTVLLLRPVAISGAALTIVCGLLLFIAQAGDYAANGWFRAKIALLTLALLNAAWHLRADPLPQRAALASLLLWPLVLLCGRMIGYS